MGNFALKITQCKAACVLYEEGYSIRQVADHFGVSHTAVKSALALLGVKHREKIAARKNRKKNLPPTLSPGPATLSATHTAMAGVGRI